MKNHSTQRGVLMAALMAALLAAPGLHAAEVGGIKLDDSVRVGNKELSLNGAGIRSRLFIKVYVGALYVSQKSAMPNVLIEATTPRRMSLRLLRDISAETLYGALEEGLANNHSAAELAALKPASTQFAALMTGIGKLKEGDAISLDFSSEGLNVGLNGESRGKVASASFGKALLKVWLGDKPADASLKTALLGS